MNQLSQTTAKIMIFVFAVFYSVEVTAQHETDSIAKPEILDEVLLRAVRIGANSPITHSNLDREAIEKRNLGQDIPMLLNFLPGVVSTSDAGAGIGYTYLRVRGSDASRINVTFNGIPFNDAESQGAFWVNLPDFASSIQNLQLQRGVGSSTNGTGAFGASLNLLTDAVSKEASAYITNSFGSFNTRRHTIKYNTGLLNNHLELSGRLSVIKSDGYIDRASSDLKSYFLQGAYVDETTLIKGIVFGGHEVTYQSWFGVDAETLLSNRRFNPAGAIFDQQGNLTGFYDNEVDNYKQDHYQLHWNQRWNAFWSTNIGLNYTYGRGYFEQYRNNDRFSTYGYEPIVVNGQTINRMDLIRRRWLDNDFYVINANATYKKSSLEITSGVFFSLYEGDHFGEVIWSQYAANNPIRAPYYFSDALKREWSAFSKATYKLNQQWQVYGDVQWRFVHYKTGGITSSIDPIEVDEKYHFFNPKAGVAYQHNTAHQFYFSYGKAHREPSRNDFREGITTPETLDNFELGWRYSKPTFSLSSNLYYMNYKNQLVLSGALNDVGAPLRTTSGSSYRLGLEVESELKLTKQWHWLANLALSRNKNRAFVASIDGQLVDLGKTNISFSPEIVAGSMLLYKPLENLEIGLLSKYVGKQFMGNIDSKASLLDSFFINDLNVAFQLNEIPIFSSVLINAQVNNIFNVKYESNGYFFTYDDDWTNPGSTTTIEEARYYPQAGTNYLAGITLKF